MNTLARVVASGITALALFAAAAGVQADEVDSSNSVMVTAAKTGEADGVRDFRQPVRPQDDSRLFGVALDLPETAEEMAAVYERDGGC